MTQPVGPFSRETSILLLCDLQEKFRSAIQYFDQIVETTNKLIQVCRLLEVPFIATEQYPKGSISFDRLVTIPVQRFLTGLGRTIPELDIGDVKPFEKTLFSMCTPEVLEEMKKLVPGKSRCTLID